MTVHTIDLEQQGENVDKAVNFYLSVGTRHHCEGCGELHNTVTWLGKHGDRMAWLCAGCVEALAELLTKRTERHRTTNTEQDRRASFGYRQVALTLTGGLELIIRHHHDGNVEIIQHEPHDLGTRTELSQENCDDLRWLFAPQRIVVGHID